MSAAVDEVSTTLSALSEGERFWLTYCPGAEPPLRVATWAAEPRLRAFLTGAGPWPPDAQPLVGLGSVEPDGRLTVATATASAAVMAQLARWAVAEVGAHPGLARLKGLQLLRTSPTGEIIRRYDTPALWSTLPDPDLPSLLSRAASQLGRLPAGRACRFWMTPRGPGGAPRLVLSSLRRDPDGADLATVALAAQRMAADAAPGVRGTLQRTQGGTLLLSCPSLEQASEALAALRATPELGGLLGEVVLVETGPGGIVRTGLDHAQRDPLAAALAALKPGSAALFWFTRSGGDGAPALLIGDDARQLRADAADIGGDGPSVRGRLRLGADGRLHLKPRTPDPQLGEAIGQLARSRPALGLLTDIVIEDRDDA